MEKQVIIQRGGAALKVVKEATDVSMLKPVKPEEKEKTREIIRKTTQVASGYIKGKKHDFF